MPQKTCTRRVLGQIVVVATIRTVGGSGDSTMTPTRSLRCRGSTPGLNVPAAIVYRSRSRPGCRTTASTVTPPKTRTGVVSDGDVVIAIAPTRGSPPVLVGVEEQDNDRNVAIAIGFRCTQRSLDVGSGVRNSRHRLCRRIPRAIRADIRSRLHAVSPDGKTRECQLRALPCRRRIRGDAHELPALPLRGGRARGNASLGEPHPDSDELQ